MISAVCRLSLRLVCVRSCMCVCVCTVNRLVLRIAAKLSVVQGSAASASTSRRPSAQPPACLTPVLPLFLLPPPSSQAIGSNASDRCSHTHGRPCKKWWQPFYSRPDSHTNAHTHPWLAVWASDAGKKKDSHTTCRSDDTHTYTHPWFAFFHPLAHFDVNRS